MGRVMGMDNVDIFVFSIAWQFVNHSVDSSKAQNLIALEWANSAALRYPTYPKRAMLKY